MLGFASWILFLLNRSSCLNGDIFSSDYKWLLKQEKCQAPKRTQQPGWLHFKGTRVRIHARPHKFRGHLSWKKNCAHSSPIADSWIAVANYRRVCAQSTGSLLRRSNPAKKKKKKKKTGCGEGGGGGGRLTDQLKVTLKGWLGRKTQT